MDIPKPGSSATNGGKHYSAFLSQSLVSSSTTGTDEELIKRLQQLNVRCQVVMRLVQLLLTLMPKKLRNYTYSCS
jgi:hypothetical protein